MSPVFVWKWIGDFLRVDSVCWRRKNHHVKALFFSCLELELCLLKPRLPLCFTDINHGFGGDSSLIITFLLLANTENSGEASPLRTRRKELIKYTSHQLHELEAAFKINQYPSVSGREYLARKIGVTKSQIQVHNTVLLQHILWLCKYVRCVSTEPRGFYHSTKNSGANFRKFPWANGTVFFQCMEDDNFSLGIFYNF